MTRAYITKELLTEDGKQLTLYYSENLDMYITENFAIRAGYCDVENEIEIIDMKECLDFSEDYIKEMIEKAYYDWDDDWDTINIDEHINDNFVRLHNSIGYVEIHNKYFQNMIKSLNCDISLPYLYKNKPIQIALDDFVVAIIMPEVFKVVDNSELDIDETLPKANIPDKIKENFIFDYICPSSVTRKNTIVKFDKWCGELNEKGELISKFKCDDLLCTENYNYITINNKEAIIDKNGSFILEPIYDRVYPLKVHLWHVIKDNKHGIIDDNNNIIWEPEFDFINTLYNNKGLFIVSKNKKYGVMDISKNIIIPFIYDYLGQDFDDTNVIFAIKDFKHGMIDTNNNVVIPFMYEELFKFGKNNLCAKISENQFIIINQQNEQICETVFNELGHYCFNRDNDVQLYLAKLNDLYGFVDELGNIKIDFKINKESLNIPETKINYNDLNTKDMVDMIFT